MYAIRNKITGQWLYGTDYNFSPPRQRISNRQAITFETLEDAELQMLLRKCGKNYEVIKVKLEITGDNNG